MTEETKCPKCGAETIKDLGGLIEFACRSHMANRTALTNGLTFTQTTICRHRAELTTLRASLVKAVEALKEMKAEADKALNNKPGIEAGSCLWISLHASSVLKEISEDL